MVNLSHSAIWFEVGVPEDSPNYGNHTGPGDLGKVPHGEEAFGWRTTVESERGVACRNPVATEVQLR